MRALVIGNGSAGVRHSRIIEKALPGRAHVTVSSRNWDRLAQSNGGSICRFWGEHNPNLVVVASPAPRHLEQIASVLDFGAPILVEKPLLADIGELLQARSVPQDFLTPIQIGYVLRHSLSFKRFQLIVAERSVEDLRKISVRAHSFLPQWRPHLDYRHSVSANSRLGGGALLELSHEIDYVLALFGLFEVVQSHLEASPLLDVDVETQCKIEGLMPNGARLEMSLDMALENEERWCEVEWEDGWKARWDIKKQTITQWQDSKLVSRESFPIGRENWHLAQMNHFLHVVSGSEQPVPGIHDGLQVMRVIDRVRKASD